jgi:RNA polymerase sigma-70 factor (ECF subfamily)
MGQGITIAEFEELYRATARDVFAYVRRHTAGDVEEIVVETYAVAWQRRGQLPPVMLRRAWLFGVARVLLLADGRRRRVAWDRLSAAEIAVVLGVRPGTVRVRLHRARQALARDAELRTLFADPPGTATLSLL